MISFKAFAAKIFANHIAKQTKKWKENPVETQNNTFRYLIKTAQNTQFGKKS